ncbi:uncharacterized protein LOC104939811 isoform X2 [Larimichthys crocea]|uniref:uncharacterized protein LOC104939811 isoform X2 n=1 Tax=Larimichthys crocea TaxID=215358 RepID=UPI000F5DFCE5|nr:uncharacterized protein LOC104939811 isoform X2 [Larimichthys crocea]
MVDFKWILIALLQFTAAEGLPPSFTVRAGQEVTLPCGNVIDDQKNCNSTTWLFSYSSQRATVALIELGQIKFNQIDKSKSDRLSVRQKCSLVIKKVTHEDAGRYDCQQWKSRQGPSYLYVVYLSVVTMTEHKNTDQVEWSCSVSTFEGWCRRTVKWLYNGNNVDEYNKDVQTSQSLCSASVTFQSSHFIHTSNSDLLKCEVTDGDKVQLFPFRLQPSGEKPGDDTRKTKPRTEPKTKPPRKRKTTTTTTTTATKPKTKPTTAPTTDSSMKRETIMTASPISDDSGSDSTFLYLLLYSVSLCGWSYS